MLSDRLSRALPTRAARIAFGAVAYAIFAATVVTATLHRDPTDTLEKKASAIQYQGQLALAGLELPRAERKLKQSIDLIKACGGEGNEQTIGWLADAHEDLADVYAAEGHLKEAETNYQKALELLERSCDPLALDLIGPLEGLKEIYETTGRDADARVCTGRITAIHSRQATFAEGEFAHFQASLEKTAKHHPVNNLEIANRLMDLGTLHFESGSAKDLIG